RLAPDVNPNERVEPVEQLLDAVDVTGVGQLERVEPRPDRDEAGLVRAGMRLELRPNLGAEPAAGIASFRPGCGTDRATGLEDVLHQELQLVLPSRSEPAELHLPCHWCRPSGGGAQRRPTALPCASFRPCGSRSCAAAPARPSARERSARLSSTPRGRGCCRARRGARSDAGTSVPGVRAAGAPAPCAPSPPCAPRRWRACGRSARQRAPSRRTPEPRARRRARRPPRRRPRPAARPARRARRRADACCGRTRRAHGAASTSRARAFVTSLVASSIPGRRSSGIRRSTQTSGSPDRSVRSPMLRPVPARIDAAGGERVMEALRGEVPSPGLREREWYAVRELWATVAIAIMWLAVLFDGVFGPDFTSTNGSGTTVIPSAVLLALFALFGTISVAHVGFRDRGSAGRS